MLGQNKKAKLRILLIDILPPEEPRAGLGIASLKAYAMQHPGLRKQISITLKNFSLHEDCAHILRYINKRRPGIIGFSCFEWNLHQVLRLVNLTRQILPGAFIVCGGPEASPISAELLTRNDTIDVIVRGYGEKPFVDIIRNRLSGFPLLGHIKGISFRKKKSVVSTLPSLPLEDLDELPSLYAGRLVPENNVKQGERILYEASRGCIFNCHFCYFDMQQTKVVRTHSMKRIEGELAYFMKHKVGRVTFVDSLLNYDNMRMSGILRFILRHNQVTKFEFEIRGDLLNDDNVHLLNELAKKDFLFRLDIGLQSIHPHVLKNINCTIQVNRLLRNTSLFSPALKKATTIDLIYGLPGDSYQGFKASLEYSLKKIGVWTQCTIFQVLPGTKLYENSAAFGLVFVPLPPHHIYSNDTYSMDDIIRSEKLVDAYDILDTFASASIILMAKKSGIDITDVFEMFVHWEKRQDVPFWESNKPYSRLRQFIKTVCTDRKQHKLIPSINVVLRHDCMAAVRRN